MKRSPVLMVAAFGLLAGAAHGQQSPTAVITAPMYYQVSGTASVGTTSTVIITAGQVGRAMKLCTLFNSTTNVWLNLTGGTAVPNAGLGIPAGGGCKTLGAPDTPMPMSAVTAITDGTTAQILTLAGG